MRTLTIVIPGNTPSKKSGQIIVCKGKMKKLLPNPLYTRWFKKNQNLMLGVRKYKGEYPAWVKMFFWRRGKHRFDYDGLCHSVLDFLKDTGAIEDDSMNHVVPLFLGWDVDKENPRCEIAIEEIGHITITETFRARRIKMTDGDFKAK